MVKPVETYLLNHHILYLPTSYKNVLFDVQLPPSMHSVYHQQPIILQKTFQITCHYLDLGIHIDIHLYPLYRSRRHRSKTVGVIFVIGLAIIGDQVVMSRQSIVIGVETKKRSIVGLSRVPNSSLTVVDGHSLADRVD